MTVWLAAAGVLLGGLVAVGIGCARASGHGKGFVALQLAGVLGTMLLLVLAEVIDRSIAFEAPLVFALMSFVGTVAFLRLRGGELK